LGALILIVLYREYLRMRRHGDQNEAFKRPALVAK